MRSLFFIGFIFLGFAPSLMASDLSANPTYTTRGYHLFPEWNSESPVSPMASYNLGIDSYSSYFAASDSLKYDYLFVVKTELHGFKPLAPFTKKGSMTAVSH